MMGLAAIGKLSLKTARPWGLALRGVFGTLAIALYFYAITHGQLSTGTLLSYTYVIFATIFSAFWLREWPRTEAIGALLVALVGSVILIRPDFRHVSAGDMAGLGSGIIGGLAITTMRDLRRTEPAPLIFLWLCGCGAATTGLALLLASGGYFHLDAPRAPQNAAWLLLLGVGIVGTLGQILLTWGLRYSGTLLTTLISLSVVPLSALAGVLFFGEQLHFHVLLGGAIILAAAIYLTISEARKIAAAGSV
jgi:drug/metabolite transporter (DMT)-like permease